jgi:hypothetical protein
MEELNKNAVNVEFNMDPDSMPDSFDSIFTMLDSSGFSTAESESLHRLMNKMLEDIPQKDNDDTANSNLK